MKSKEVAKSKDDGGGVNDGVYYGSKPHKFRARASWNTGSLF